MPIPVGNTSPTYIISLADAYAELNVTNPDGSDDVELQGFIDAITRVIENIVGPVVPRPIVETYPGGNSTIILRSYPVQSVTSVTEYTPSATVLNAEPLGTSSYTASGYRLEPDIGRLTRTSGGLPTLFCPVWSGTSGEVQVSYVAGQSSVPKNIRLGALELLRLHWQPQQSGNWPGEEPDNTDFGAGTMILGFFVPNKVMDLLKPDQVAPKVA